MRILQSSVFRAICAVVVGILLIKNPGDTMIGITIAIGVLFLVSGIISCIAYLIARRSYLSAQKDNVELYDSNGNAIRRHKPMFPIVGIGSVLLGVVLALMPGTFVSFLMYFLGAILILGALSQLFSLIAASRRFSISLWFYLCPVIILLTGLFVVFKPMESASLPLIIIGWGMIVYGVVECINVIKVYLATRQAAKAAEAVEVTEENEEQGASTESTSLTEVITPTDD